MQKNILKIKILFFVLLLAATKVSAQTWYIGFPTDTDVTATLDNNTLTISGTGAMKDWDYSIRPWSSVTKVIIEDGVTSVGAYAFAYCYGLTSVTIGSSVETIGNWAFAYCYGLTSITMDSLVQTIGAHAFAYCYGLTSVTIPDSVETIGAWAFAYCFSLTSVTIPGSVQTIGAWAFSHCSSLTSVAIPDSVEMIGDYAFADCAKLTRINVDAANSAYFSENGVLFNKDKTILICCPGGKTNYYFVPNSVQTISDYAFNSCSDLTSITISNSVETIGDYAFCQCEGLIFVTIGSSVQTIGSSAFSDCYNLTEIVNLRTIPQTIDADVFDGVDKTACTLKVPVASVDLYEAADVWNDFDIILSCSYTITASAGNNGFITPSGVITLNQGESQAYTFTPNSGYEISRVLVDGINNLAAVSAGSYTFSDLTSNHMIWVSFQPECLPNAVILIWDDVLSVINNPANNGGYTFVDDYQWFKNGVEIPGEISGNLYLPNGADKASISQYTCRVTTLDSQIMQTCPLSNTLSTANVYPNPTEGIVIIESPILKEGDQIDVYSSTGTYMMQFTAQPRQTEINIGSLPKGLYVIKVNGKQIKIVRL